MAMPNINTSATGIELNPERRALITQKLAPLGRLLVHEREIKVDVVIRRVESQMTGGMFYVSAKLETENGTYMAVSTSHYLTRALTEVREYLRRSISRGASVADGQLFRGRPAKTGALAL